MTYKERLENIDKRAKHKVLGNIEGEIKYRLTEINTKDYEWLIEQAERVQELEEEIRRIRQMKYHEAYEQGKFDTNMKVWYEIPELEQQNKRYQKAIKECLERMNEGGAGTRSFVYERLIEVLEGESNELG